MILRCCLIAGFFLGAIGPACAAETARPNLVVILADDLGWGDVGCNNPKSKIPTPHLDRLALQGMRFTDAHSSSGVCVPSRFSLLTGLHAFRMKGKGHPEPEYRHRYGGNQPTVPLISRDTATLAGILQKGGYATSMVGKWHLGFDDLLRRPTEPLRGGPTDRGFDRYFGIPSSLDIGPYVFIEKDRIVSQATDKMAAHGSPRWPKAFMGEFWREDLAAPGYRHAEVLPELTRRAEAEVERLARQASERPFFFYFALPAPHSPLLPAKAFRGRTRLGEFSIYGDYVVQTDDAIGRVLAVLKKVGVEENTLVLLTSDNGPLWYPENVRKTGHEAAGPWRGMKGDAWEGGHRIPLIARWPGRVPKKTVSHELVSLTDVMATVVGALGIKTDTAVASDGVDFSPVLLGKAWQRPRRNPVVVRSSRGATALRIGLWAYIDRLGSGGFSEPMTEKPVKDGPTVQLYDLRTDPGEASNLAAEPRQAGIIAEFAEALDRFRARR